MSASERGNHRLRALDRYGASILVEAIALLRRRRTRPRAPGTIGLMKATALGDMVLLSAIVRELRCLFPGARLVMFAGQENAEVARLLPGLDEVVDIRPALPWITVQAIRAHPVDVLLDFGPWTRVEALYSGLSRSGATAGFRQAGSRRHVAYDLSVEHSGQQHELDNYRALAGVLGPMAGFPPELRPAGEAPPVLGEVGPFAVLHPWPGGFRSEHREWPAPRWMELARRLRAEGLEILLSGAPRDAAGGRALAGSMTVPVRDLTGALSLTELTHVLSRSVVVISVNTGIMHMAAALGASTIGLNGPTSERRWGPVGARAISVNSPLEGCGYLNLGWEYEGQRTDCMQAITVEAVMEAVAAVRGAPAP